MAYGHGIKPHEVEVDRINGVILGAALGDALGRVTMSLDKTSDMKQIYGKGGVTSFEYLKKNDWIFDGKKEQKAPYASNTVLSLLVLDILAEVRQSRTDKKVMAERIGSGLVRVFGEDHRTWDPYFDLRHYSLADLEKGEQMIDRKTARKNAWWAVSEEGIAKEADSGALDRAWPVGLVYADHISSARYYTDYLITITHRHPSARAAASALVTGVAHALQGASVDDMVNHMIQAAEKFDELELKEKTAARKVMKLKKVSADMIARDKMLTSDLIRFAAYAAKEGMEPEDILGSNGKEQDNGRSYRGYLLGTQADEAVAAAVYLIVRNPENLKAIVAEGSFAAGNSALITSLAGAFYGARHGLSGITRQGFEKDLTALENKEVILELAGKVHESLRHKGVFYDNKGSDKDFEELVENYHHPKSAIFTLKNLVILGAIIGGAYLVKEYVVPRVRAMLA